MKLKRYLLMLFAGMMIALGVIGILELKKTFDLIVNCRINQKYANAEQLDFVNYCEGGGMLCNCINYECYTLADNSTLLYNSNQYMIISSVFSRPMLYNYCARPGIKRKNERECRKNAHKTVYTAVPNDFQKGKLTLSSVTSLDGAFSYIFYFSDAADKAIYVTVRYDTGKIMYFDASALFS